MKISSSAVSLNVEDVAASSAFLVEHFGFQEDMAADGFAPSRWVIQRSYRATRRLEWKSGTPCWMR